jgi:flagellar M-ring protein FliF
MNGMQLDRQQQIERDLTTKVMALLEPVVGAGRVRVNVAADLEANAVEETEERFDPNAVVRSRQTTTETSAAALAAAGLGGSLGSSAGGVAGSRANQPPALSTANTPPAGGGSTGEQAASGGASGPSTSLAALPGPLPGRSSETTNYEVSKVTRHTVSPQGQLARLSVAVILDDERVTSRGQDGSAQTATRAWDAKGLERISGLVAAAVGLDAERGDQLTVENIPFDPAPVEPLPEPSGVMTQLTDVAKTHWPTALRGVAVVLIALVALFGVLRPLARRAGALSTVPELPALSASGARLPTVREMEGQIEAELDAMAANGDRRLPVLTQRVAKLASDEPEQVARIVRGWMAEGEK